MTPYVEYTDVQIGASVGYRLPDRAPGQPFIGFVVGAGLGLLLWVFIGAGLWALVV